MLVATTKPKRIKPVHAPPKPTHADHDRGYEEYHHDLLKMSIRRFNGHLECMPYNAEKMPPSFTRAMLDVKRALEKKGGAYDDETPVSRVLFPDDTLPIHEPLPVSDKTPNIQEQPPSMGHKATRVDLLAYRWVPRNVCEKNAQVEDDPPPTAAAEFAATMALSAHNRQCRDSVAVTKVDLNKLKDPGLRDRAVRLYGRGVGTITFNGPLFTEVYYDLHTGAIEGVGLWVPTRDVHNRFQPTYRKSMKDLWDMIDHGTSEKTMRGTLPTHSIIQYLVDRRYAHLMGVKDADKRIKQLQHSLEEWHKKAYEEVEYETVSSWGSVYRECLRLASTPNAFEIALFLWKYMSHFDPGTAPRKQLLLSEPEKKAVQAKKTVNPLIILLSRWLGIHLDWLFSAGVESLQYVGTKRSREDADEKTTTCVHVLYGPPRAGKSDHCTMMNTKEVFSLFEFQKYVTHFPHKNVYLTVSCKTLQQARTILKSQQFVYGTTFRCIIKANNGPNGTVVDEGVHNFLFEEM
jgi:hypothetical protein